MAKLIEMGQITTLGIDGDRTDYKMALLIEFDSVESIRKAIADGRCEFGDVEPVIPQPTPEKRG
jgi:hypothetical protein